MLGTSPQPEGITNPPIDDLLEKVDSKYGLVVEAAKRARQINTYTQQLEDNQFEWGPIAEVATLFIGIFLTMIPALHYLDEVAGSLPLNEVTFFVFTGGLSSVLDNAYVQARSLVPLIARLAEVETSVYRLAMQIRRTVRRVNALEKVFIPRCEAQVRSIAAALEENEREDMTRIKLSSGREM